MRALLCAAIIGLSGCAATPPERSLPAALSTNAEALKSFLSDTTSKGFTQGFGTQVWYLSPQGTSTLLLPGSATPATGTWRVDFGAQGAEVCFSYKADPAIPLTVRFEGQEVCTPAEPYFNTVDVLVDGNPLGLSARSKLFLLLQPNEDVSLSRVQTFLGQQEQPLGPNKLGP